MKKSLLTFSVLLAAGASFAQEAVVDARAEYQREQALAEVPRLVQQFDVLAQNQEEIAQRLVKLEQADNTGGLRTEIDALRAEIADLRASIRREQDAMRAEIVRDLAARMAKMTPPPPPPAPAPAPVVVNQVIPPTTVRTAPPPAKPSIGPYYEYVVKSGETLSYIADGFGTTVAKILAANPNVKPNVLRVGQKLIIPEEDKSKLPARKPAPARRR